jgi:muconolactone D-isomerase
MLFHATMTVNLPHEMAETTAEALKAAERERRTSTAGKWRHLWRVAGRYANVSIFDVEDADQLHVVLTSLPLSPSCRSR